MNSEDLFKVNLNLRGSDFNLSNSKFSTTLDIKYLEYKYSYTIKSYFQDLNSNLNRILNSENLTKRDYSYFKSFFIPEINSDAKFLFSIFEHIGEFRKNILRNIDFIDKQNFSNIEEKEECISKLYELNLNFTNITKSNLLIEFKELLDNQKIFNGTIFHLLDNDYPEEQIKKFILLNNKNNYEIIYEKYLNTYKKILQFNDEFMNVTDNISKKFIKNEIQTSNLALTSYIDIFNKNNFTNFNEFLKNYIHLENCGNIKGLALFEDNSMLIEYNDNTFEQVFSKKERLQLKDKCSILYLREKYKKNPFICKDFIDIIKLNTDYNLAATFELFEKYIKNIDIINNYDFDLKSFIINSDVLSYDRKIEQAEDKLTEILLDNSVKQTIKGLTSSKNIHLFNEESHDLIKQIFNEKIKIETLNNFIGKKIARFKTSEDLNLALNQFINSFGFSYEGIINKANDLGIDILSKDNNTVILQINNFEQSSAIGSASWCICSSVTYFNSYTSNESKQYFIFDFNKDKSSNESLIGITLDKEGNLNAAHLKNDESIDSDTPEISSFLNIIREKNKKIKQLNLKI